MSGGHSSIWIRYRLHRGFAAGGFIGVVGHFE
ncbi:unnamed protein product, partial [Rotaria sp. Silwood1]